MENLFWLKYNSGLNLTSLWCALEGGGCVLNRTITVWMDWGRQFSFIVNRIRFRLLLLPFGLFTINCPFRSGADPALRMNLCWPDTTGGTDYRSLFPVSCEHQLSSKATGTTVWRYENRLFYAQKSWSRIHEWLMIDRMAFTEALTFNEGKLSPQKALNTFLLSWG